MFELSRRLLTEERGQASVPGCPPDTTLRSRPYQSPLVSYVTIRKPDNKADADVQFLLPIPATSIWVVSGTQAENNNSLFLHFVPLNKQYPGIAILPVGDEQWLPLTGQNAGGATGRLGSIILFDVPLPVTTMFLDIGQESGGVGGPITLAVSQYVRWLAYPGTTGAS